MEAVSHREVLEDWVGGRSEGCRHRSGMSQSERLTLSANFKQGVVVRLGVCASV